MFKRYKPFFRAGAMDLMAYKFTIYSWLLVTALQVACIIFLWLAVYNNAENGVDSIINGFSFKNMITYMVMINIFNFVTMDSNTMYTITDEIRNGTIAMSFVKPISYRIRFSVTTLGSLFAKMVFFGLPLFIVSYTVFVLIGYIEIVSIWKFLIYLVLFLISQVVAAMLDDVISYIFGIFSFYTYASFGLSLIKLVIFNFFSGTMIPLAFFPGFFGEIVKYLPYSGMAQNPVLILLMNIDLLDALKYLGLSIIWIIILELFAKFLFNRASKKITVQGG